MAPRPRRLRRPVRFVLAAFPILILVALLPDVSWTRPAEYDDLKARAEKEYAEGSYGRAHDLYLEAAALRLPEGERRWVSFRVADTLWRSKAATATADPADLDRARKELEALVRDAKRPEERDRVVAEAEESLGDFFWTRRDVRDFGQGWPHYQRALDWWAGSSDIEAARGRYLAIVFRMAEPRWRDPWYVYGHAGNILPVEVIENALRIARTGEDRAHAHYLLAMSLRSFGGGDDPFRVAEEFEAALAVGKGTEWYDDALFHYAAWMESGGIVVHDEDGNLRQEPDFPKARDLYRRLLKEFAKGETRYLDDARRRIEEITRPVVDPAVGHVFLPGSEVRFDLAWRNVATVAFALHRVDLAADLDIAGLKAGNWIDAVDLARATRLRSWTHETKDKGDHRPGRDAILLDGSLPPGAYVLVAEGGGLVRRDLVLVTDAALVLKVSPSRVLAYLCDAADGSPIPGVTVTLWRWRYVRGKAIGSGASLRTDADGLALFPLPEEESHFLAAAAGDRQAFSVGSARLFRAPEALRWRIYAFTDRPAYRPGDEVHWKAVVRESGPAGYATPAGKPLKYVITDPRGAKVKEGSLTLNAFGSAWDSLELSGAMPLGEYRVAFEGPSPVGAAVLFRLEEYKLPEFNVTVLSPVENGRTKTFRPGETAKVAIAADYYSGGPVAGAEVEAVVYRRPFTPAWRPPADFPWLRVEEGTGHRDWYGAGDVVRREKMKTDAAGKALIALTAPRGGRQDLEFTVEARVTDASRREVTGRGSVRVTRQRYFVHAHPEHRVYRPKDRVTVEFRSLDGNEQPVSAQGTLKVVRSRYVERWIDPRGKEVSGTELEAAMGKGRVLPPPPGPDGVPWRPKFRGFVDEEVLTQTVKTDREGKGAFSFTPGGEGYYRFRWTSEKGDRFPVRAETAVHVASDASADIGYRHGGLEILVDKDAVRPGEPLAVMLVAPASGRPVLFSVEGEDMESHRLVRLDGTVKLLSLPVEERHVPNVVLAAATVSDLQMHRAEKEILVPPVKNVLDLRVETDRDVYRPGAEGAVTVTARDHAGNPVAAEVGLSLADESIHAIQEDYAGDPRPFFFGTRRGHGVRTQSSFDHKRYVRLVRTEEGRLVDERDLLLARIAGVSPPSGEEDEAGRDARLRSAVPGRPAPAGVLGRAPREGVAEAKAMADAAREAAKAPSAPPSGGEPAVVVRADFRATALWLPDLVTGADGKATAKVTYPQSLTAWRATARAATQGAQVGIARAAARTEMPLTVRLQAPRFFVVGDAATVSAVINNNTDREMTVTPALDAAGLTVEGVLSGGRPAKGGPKPVVLPAGGTGRADWLVAAKAPGTARLAVSAKGGGHGDAMTREYPVHEHGVQKFVAASGKVRGDEGTFVVHLPRERRPGSTAFVVIATPSLAATMLDALPYLADYPYGCTEQTMSRFLPAAVTAKTLKDLGLPPGAVQDRIFGGIEAADADKTHPGGRKDLRKLDEMVARGLARLYDFQHADGGWGWWKEGESDRFMSAYVLWGLSLARDAGIDVRPDVTRRAAAFLEKEIVKEEENPDMQAWMLHALAVEAAGARRAGAVPSLPEKEMAKAAANLWAKRDRLDAYGRALLALSAHASGEREKAAVLARNLENGVKRDEDPGSSPLLGGKEGAGASALGTAHWGADGIARRWSEGAVEATATALRALLAVDPKHPLVEPVTAWLIRNRRGAQWSNTRDTAMAVLALNDYLKASGEAASAVEYEVAVNGRPIARVAVRPGEALSAPASFPVDGKELRDGRNEVRVRGVGGSGPLYVSVRADFFSLEEPVAPAGHEIFVRREYVRLAGRPTLLQGTVFDKVPLPDGGTATSGERVEVVVTVEAKNDLEYLVLEDLKAAGLEAVEVKSGAVLFARELKAEAVKRRFAGDGSRRGDDRGERRPAEAGTAGAGAAPSAAGAVIMPVAPLPEESDYTGRTRRVYRELRDRKAALFIDKLPEGVWEIRYEMRAEVPGRFHALPLLGHAMYVPEIRGNGGEARITIADRP